MDIDLNRGLELALDHKRRNYPQHVNRASNLDDPCLRRLYYRRAAWDKPEPVPTGLLGIFETGNHLEPVIERIVSEVGHASAPMWRIVGNQTPTNDKFLSTYKISGTIDGFLQVHYDGTWATVGVVDIKTCGQNMFPRLDSYEALGRYPWTRAYRGQLQIYAFAHDMENCYILFVSKQNLYDMRFIHFPVDMNYVEGLLRKAEAVNEAIETLTPPEGICDPDVCPGCPWYSYCAPDMTTGGNLRIVDNDELAVVLLRMDELSAANKEYRDLEKQRDCMLTKGQDAMVGEFLIKWKQASNGAWRKSIVRL